MSPSIAIAVLKGAGLTEQVIAAAVGISQSTVNRIHNEVMQPTYGVGKALVDMAAASALKRDSAQLNNND